MNAGYFLYYLLKRGMPGNVETGNQEMNVVRTLIGHHTFEVHHVSHDAVFAGDTHTAENLPGFAGHFEGHIDIVALGHRNLCGRGLTLVFELSQTKGQQLRFGDLGDHFGQFLLL